MALKKSQESLKKWTKQKWRTSDGTKSEGKKRYLPDAAWKALSQQRKPQPTGRKQRVIKRVSSLSLNPIVSRRR